MTLGGDISVLFSLDEAPFFPSRRVSSGISNMAGLTSAADLVGQLFKGDFHVFGPPGSNPWAAVDPRAFKVSFGTIQTNYLGLSPLKTSIFRKNNLPVKMLRPFTLSRVTRSGRDCIGGKGGNKTMYCKSIERIHII